jgi:hypothetical protein
MKNIFLTSIAILALSFASCKKTPSPTPSTANQHTTPPPVVTNTTTPSDTVGKIKVFYMLSLDYVTTTNDFLQDTSGVKMYLNSTYLTNHLVSTSPSTGLNTLSTQGQPAMAMWVKKGSTANSIIGDSLVINLAHVEFRYGVGGGNTATVRVTIEIWDANGNAITSDGVNPYINITNNSTTYGNQTGITYYNSYYNQNSAPLIGHDQSNINWYLGNAFKYVYHF